MSRSEKSKNIPWKFKISLLTIIYGAILFFIFQLIYPLVDITAVAFVILFASLLAALGTVNLQSRWREWREKDDPK